MKPNEALALVHSCSLDASEAAARRIQSLWGGMGSIYSITSDVNDAKNTPIVAKLVKMPRGALSIGDERKRKSYQVEAAFYASGIADQLLAAGCTVPRPLNVVCSEDGHDVSICMSLLPTDGSSSMGPTQTKAAMSWLAKLHALFWGTSRADAAVAQGLQPQGTYWYLDTRLDEFDRMPSRGWEGRLKLAARALDGRLKADPMQTIVHGDAKDANMLFARDGSVGLCDFQYIGKACAVKDVAYCLCCASNVPRAEEEMVCHYHTTLSTLLEAQGDVPPPLEALKESLELAFCDLGRWMSGWGWWGHDLSARIVKVLDRLDGGMALCDEAAYEERMRLVFPVVPADA